MFFPPPLVVDMNDNAPTFIKDVYKFSVDETVNIGETLYTKVAVTDPDDGVNSNVRLTCVSESSPEACDTFDIRAQVSRFLRVKECRNSQ